MTHQQLTEWLSQCGHQRICLLTDLWYKGVRLCFLLPGWGWQDMEEERGIGMGPVEADGVEPVLRATGGSEEPLSISDTGDRTGICCWEEATALKLSIYLVFLPTVSHNLRQNTLKSRIEAFSPATYAHILQYHSNGPVTFITTTTNTETMRNNGEKNHQVTQKLGSYNLESLMLTGAVYRALPSAW